jgi:hypothetical protein
VAWRHPPFVFSGVTTETSENFLATLSTPPPNVFNLSWILSTKSAERLWWFPKYRLILISKFFHNRLSKDLISSLLSYWVFSSLFKSQQIVHRQCVSCQRKSVKKHLTPVVVNISQQHDSIYSIHFIIFHRKSFTSGCE